MARCWRKSGLCCWIHPAAQSTLGKQQWDLLVSEHSVGFHINIGILKSYAGEMITPACTGLGVGNNSERGFLVWSLP